MGWRNDSVITGSPDRNTPPVVDPSTGTCWPSASSASTPTAVETTRVSTSSAGRSASLGTSHDGLLGRGELAWWCRGRGRRVAHCRWRRTPKAAYRAPVNSIAAVTMRCGVAYRSRSEAKPPITRSDRSIWLREASNSSSCAWMLSTSPRCPRRDRLLSATPRQPTAPR
jgi:hypothetical protein